MAIRARLKRVLTFGKDSDSKRDPRLNDPNIYYQPGEKMPPLKYRRPVAPEHKAHLEAFNWDHAWRPHSVISQYSPMGSRLHSRCSSRVNVSRLSCEVTVDARQSMESEESLHTGKDSRSNDGFGVDSGFGGSLSDETLNHTTSHADTEDSDATNGSSPSPATSACSSYEFVSAEDARHDDTHPTGPFIVIDGLSTSATSSPASSLNHDRRPSGSSFTPEQLAEALRRSSRENNVPTQEELDLALRRSYLEPPRDGPCARGIDTSPRTSLVVA
ncbi:hypothetical protein M011DRAFT_200277 [Sporormia fimetaria CBS 119925]|uniref:Uncharacterized protein n=1 Tax=Sporormia fimetaria CBS 119925 TaxID=1340428 RepID=A0A6A6V097_9PLEO|nr:hypothetical protein M011DRAFT_200277 [Sporormia fimetaria CBS 119925]